MHSITRANSTIMLFTGILLCQVFLNNASVIAQPSGGPYGPIQQNYDIPEIEGDIYYAAPDAKAEASLLITKIVNWRLIRLRIYKKNS